MAFNFKVKTIFNAVGNMGKFFKQSATAAKKFGNDASRAFRKASRAGSGFRSVLKGVLGANLITGGLRFLAQGLREVTTQFISFDDAIISAAAKFDDLNITTAEGQRQLNGLRDVARNVGATTEFFATQAGQGLDFLALAGVNAKQAIALLPGVVNLATVSQQDLASATTIAVDALGAFNLMTKDSAKLQTNFTRLNDVMAKTMTSTNTNIEDMFEAIKKGAPIFMQGNQNLETFNALIGTLAGAGIKGSEAGTQLRNAILRLTNITPAAQRELNKLGLGGVVADMSGNVRDIVDILADFEKALKGIGGEQRLAILGEIFGTRAVTGISVLLSRGTDSIRTFRQTLLDAAGTTLTIAEIMRSSLGVQLKTLGSAALEVGFKILDAFAGKGEKAIKDFTKFLREVDVKPLIRVMKNLVAIFGNLFQALKPIGPVITGILIPALSLITSAMAGNPEIISAAVTAWALYAAGLWLVNAAQLAVLASNPLTWIVLGIAAVVAGIVWMVKNWDLVIDKVKQFGRFLLIDVVQPFLRFTSTVSRFLSLGFDNPISTALDSIANNIELGSREVTTNVTGQQRVRLDGQINVAGLPAGSTGQIKQTEDRRVAFAFAGVNP